MLHSMTGYGEAQATIDQFVVAVTIYACNSRQLDIRFDIPHTLIQQEIPWRKLVAAQLHRGRIVITLAVKPLSSQVPLRYLPEQKAFAAYYEKLTLLAQSVGATNVDLFTTALQLMMQNNEEQTLPSTVSTQLATLLQQAITLCSQSRATEGLALLSTMQADAKEVLQHITVILAHLPKRDAILRARFVEKMQMREQVEEPEKWKKEIDYCIEKIDLQEELVRLQQHMAFFSTTLKAGGVIGKKLLFILQEAIRESNTLGAKAQDVTIQHAVIKLKQLLEQLKEQAYNIL